MNRIKDTKDFKMIKDEFVVILKTKKKKKVKQLTTNLISRTKWIFFEGSIEILEFFYT